MSDETKPAGKISSAFRSSLERQDLSSDRFLTNVPRAELDGSSIPSLGGIPLLRKLGEGGMGAVYYGIHPRLKMEVAVKVLNAGIAERNAELKERFVREGQICARIKSDHLVGVIDVNEQHGLRYLVMEYVNGPSAGVFLRQLQSAGKKWLKEADALEICIGACAGLAAAHAQGVIHRDIKPDNILIPLGKDGAPQFSAAKLTDLGLAHCDLGDVALTRPGAVFGTPGFLAPEQSADSSSAGKPADVFGIGATIYALLTGHAPFSGDSALEIILATRRKPHVPIRETRAEISTATAAMIDRCMAKDPAQRYADGAILVKELQRCRESLGRAGSSSQAPAALVMRAVEQGSSTHIGATHPESSQKNTFPKSAARVAAALFVLIAALAIGFATFAAHNQPAPSPLPAPAPPPALVSTKFDAPMPNELSVDLGGGVKLELALVPAGVLEVSETRKINFPSFYIGKYPVTVAQFRRFALDKKFTTEAESEGDGKQLIKQHWEDVPGASWKNPGFNQGDDHPVVMVTLADAEAFARWAVERTEREVVVPNEVEWEYAARGTEKNTYPWGKTWDGSRANHADSSLKQSANCPADAYCSADNDGFAFTSPVGRFNNGSWCGAFDMAGNIYQWCEHPYGATKDNQQRGWVRGGSWESPPDCCETTYRRKLDEHFRSSSCGFRIVVRRKAGEGNP